VLTVFQAKDMLDVPQLLMSQVKDLSFSPRCISYTNMLDADLPGQYHSSTDWISQAVGKIWMSVQLLQVSHGFWVQWVGMVLVGLTLERLQTLNIGQWR